MKRVAKKTGEKRKTNREKVPSQRQGSRKRKEVCVNCSKGLTDGRVLFVEEEVGRVFCSEGCITDFFSPEIRKTEKEYFSRLSSSDLEGEERESLAHLRWLTLQEPDEVWVEKTLSGDLRYTLISEFQPNQKKIWYVCICLFLRGEPSFLFLAFPTRNAAMMHLYRKGEKIEWKSQGHSQGQRPEGANVASEGNEMHQATSDRLGTEWTEDENIRAKLMQGRSPDDIPTQEYNLYHACLEETLNHPHEVWSVSMKEKNSLQLYHFIRHYPNEDSGMWYIIVARETDNEEQIELLDAFPTSDPGLVDRYRSGNQELGATSLANDTRVVH